MTALKRTGLHRCECEHECGAYVYGTVANLEQHGAPMCACGGRFIPDHPDLAAAVCPDVLEAHPAVVAYRRELARVLQGRKGSHVAVNFGEEVRQREAKSADARLPAEELAGQRVAQQRRAAAHARRIAHLRRGRSAVAPVDPIPF